MENRERATMETNFFGRKTFNSGGEKMSNASGHQSEHERQWKNEKAYRSTYEISSIKLVTRKIHVVVLQNIAI